MPASSVGAHEFTYLPRAVWSRDNGVGGRQLITCFYEQRKERRGEASPSSPVTPVKVPDCPVPASLLEELLRPPPAVSKEPLRNLNSCLQQLKYEGLCLMVLSF